VRDACQRHLADLEHGHKRGLVYNADQAKRAIGFFKDLLHLNGGEAWNGKTGRASRGFEGKPFALEGWQAFIVGSLFGWQRKDGFRRFRTAYIETGKGSGKSPLVAGIGLYGLMADGEARAEVYAAATKKDQAMILFRDAVAMMQQSPWLQQHLEPSGGRGHEWNLAFHKTASFFRPISSDDGQSGPRPHIALLDEVHEHKSPMIVDMMRAGTKGRNQALICMITNSGVDKNSVCWHYHAYATKVVANHFAEKGSAHVLDDSFFGYVCALDADDDPFTDESCWIKANPNLGITIQKTYLRELVNEARGMPSKASIVRRLNFCQWVQAFSPWISSERWFAAGSEFNLAEMRGRRCFGGLDLSSTTDLTALVLVFPPLLPGEKWKMASWFWLPEDGFAEKEKTDHVPYLAWRTAGYLETTPGAAINKTHVAHRVMEITSPFELAEMAYDRWRIADFYQALDDDGLSLPLVPFGQGYKDMAPAVDEFERLLVSNNIEHNNNPVMTWCAANAVVTSDPAGNRKVSKEKASGRVDGIVAGVMAIGRASVVLKPVKSFWELESA